MPIAKCIACYRTYSEDRFSALQFYAYFSEYFKTYALEVRRCSCGVTIGVERNQRIEKPSFDNSLLLVADGRIAHRSNKRRER